MSSLNPLKEGQKVNYAIWEEYTPYENKLELIDGEALRGGEERDRMLLMLIYNVGLDHLVKMLPDESIKLLKELVNGPQ